MSYVSYKFQKAMGELTRTGLLTERLITAYLVNLVHLDAQDLPYDLRLEFDQFKKDISRVDMGENALSVEATVNTMQETDVKRMAYKITTMYEFIMESEMSPDIGRHCLQA